MAAPSESRVRNDEGYSLIEIMVTILIASILLAFSVGSFRAWASAKDQEGTASTVQSVLRQTQTRSITEGVSFCVSFNPSGTTYLVSRFACGTSTEPVLGPMSIPANVALTDVSFILPDGSLTREVTFKPTGTATPGSLKVTRQGSEKTYTVTVEGFTGRVSTS